MKVVVNIVDIKEENGKKKFGLAGGKFSIKKKMLYLLN